VRHLRDRCRHRPRHGLRQPRQLSDAAERRAGGRRRRRRRRCVRQLRRLRECRSGGHQRRRHRRCVQPSRLDRLHRAERRRPRRERHGPEPAAVRAVRRRRDPRRLRRDGPQLHLARDLLLHPGGHPRAHHQRCRGGERLTGDGRCVLQLYAGGRYLRRPARQRPHAARARHEPARRPEEHRAPGPGALGPRVGLRDDHGRRISAPRATRSGPSMPRRARRWFPRPPSRGRGRAARRACSTCPRWLRTSRTPSW
jgi:hypothetical protein